MLAVYYDQQPQPLSDDPAADGSFNYSLPESQPGQSLTFGLRNTTDQPVGVVLLVNGVSTLYLLEGELADLTKWVLEPRKEYRVKGFHHTHCVAAQVSSGRRSKSAAPIAGRSSRRGDGPHYTTICHVSHNEINRDFAGIPRLSAGSTIAGAIARSIPFSEDCYEDVDSIGRDLHAELRRFRLQQGDNGDEDGDDRKYAGWSSQDDDGAEGRIDSAQ